MLRTLVVILALSGVALPGTSAAADWAYEGGDVPIAYVDNGAAQLQFACRGGDLTVGFWVRSPHRTVAGAQSMSMAITPDPAEGSKTASDPASRFAQDMPLIHSDGASLIVRGPVARQWARIAQAARQSVQLAYVRSGQKGLETFDANRFSASGSSAAIRQVLETCG
jgi:hypothetical protein